MTDRLHRFRQSAGQFAFRRSGRPQDAGLLVGIRAQDYSTLSDAELRDVLAAADPHSQNVALPTAYAIVAEAVNRRLGAWRLFDNGDAPASLQECRDIADDILATAPYRDHVEYYTDEHFVDRPRFAAGLDSALDRLHLGPDARAIVAAIVYVAEKRKSSIDRQIMLPAEFYKAVSSLDGDGELAFRVTDEQLVAAVKLHRGVVVEMNAGEGKTVTAAFPAIMHPLDGRRVHVVTANDYLALRDAEWLAPVYESLGISVSAVLGHMGDDERRKAYRAQIVYGTVRELGFDFLRDNMRLSADETVQRGQDVAIVDEADQTLIDEAHAPLIISGGAVANVRGIRRADNAVRRLIDKQTATVSSILADLQRHPTPGLRRELFANLSLADPDNPELVRSLSANTRLRKQVRAEVAARETDAELDAGLYYVVDERRQTVTLTDLGHKLVEQELGPLSDVSELNRRLRRIEGGSDQAPLEEQRRDAETLRRQISRRSNLASQVHQLLHAHVLLRRDADYIVTGGEVVLVDPVTGRRRPDSRYQHGLHAAIEAKEGLPFRPEPEVQAQISVQGYIGLYSHVAGMTGTALAAADEFRRFYGLSVEAVPPTNRSVRTDHATRVFDNQSEKLAALVDDVVHWHRMGRPVLVGTAAVEQSEEISALLRDHEIEHTVLNAVTCSAEADIVKAAGNFGAVTVATNMAGRGTDILLEPGLDERITDGCVEMVRAALAGGAAQVALQCSTPGEVSIAERALSAAGVRTHGGDQLHDVVATSGRTASMPGSPVVFEFGLGLHVMGTELNESRRIDDQLRGRVGRQGAFGSTRFLVAQDDRSVFAQPGDRPSYRGERRTGSNGVPYLEGQRTQRAVDSLQQLGERDSELDRVAAWEFNKIVERQTLAYYALRRVFLGSESIRDAVSRFAKAAARRLIDCHLPESAISSYEARFGRLAEELQLDYQIDLSSSFGLGLESLRSAVGELIIARVRRVESECRHTDFAAFARLLMVQTADEQWPVHLSRLHDMMLSAHLSGYPVDRTVAEYALAATNEYDGFIRAASDSFLVKLAAYREAAAGPEPELAHELQEILA